MSRAIKQLDINAGVCRKANPGIFLQKTGGRFPCLFASKTGETSPCLCVPLSFDSVLLGQDPFFEQIDWWNQG